MEATKIISSLTASKESNFDVKSFEKKCFEALNDDFNTPILIAHLFEAVKQINLIKNKKASLDKNDLDLLKSIFTTFTEDILGLKIEGENNANDMTKDVMEIILKLRKHAKTNQDFTTADLIRKELDSAGIKIKDTREGTLWELNK